MEGFRLAEKASYIDIRNNLEILNVGQVVEIVGKEDLYVGTITEIDYEARGFWLSLKTKIEGMEDWDFPNSAFFYEIDINKLRIVS
jgi:hypothetical protein